MRNFYKIMAMAVVAMTVAVFTGCSSDDDFLSPYEESAIQTRATNATNAIIDFDNVPADGWHPTSMEPTSIQHPQTKIK